MNNEIVNTWQSLSASLLEKFKIQLQKDFEQSNYPVDFISGLSGDYHTLVNTLVRHLKEAENKTSMNLMQLLYRVDISESQLKQYLHVNRNKEYFEVIAELIIKRELQKVVIKEKLKDGNNS